jgi:hypothetical protein
MSETARPYLVMDAVHLDDVDGPPYRALLDWLRSEGINPDLAKRCEVYEAHDGNPPYAIVTLYVLNENGVKVLDVTTREAVTYKDVVPLSSMPPSREV